MNVLVSGSTGLIGSALVSALEGAGHRVTGLSRRGGGDGTVRWDPEAGEIEAGRLEGVEAVVHLAGESIVPGGNPVTSRWTESKKRRILESRTKGTRLLAETVAALDPPPRVMVSASGINYYGDRGDEVLREESAPGTSFLARVCREWEAAAGPAREAGIRVVHTRFGIVLSPKGGALGATLPIFRLGAGGRIGSGRQWWSWVALDDAVGAIVHALTTDSLAGPANVGSPEPLINAAYTRVLGQVLNRPTLFPLPASVARLALGEVADELLLTSLRIEPAKLTQTGYEFRYLELEGALRHLLGR